jgi:hypothetical protein
MTDALVEILPLACRPGSARKLPTVQLTLMVALVLVCACKPKPETQAPAAQQAPQAAQMEAAAPAQDASVSAIPRGTAATDQSPTETKTAPKAGVVSDAAAGKAASIAGGWVNAGGACDSGASVQFNPDGTYMSEGENGTWALEGKTLTVTTSATAEAERVVQAGPEQSTGDSGEKAVLTVLSVTDSSASVILSNGTNANWTRCSS